MTGSPKQGSEHLDMLAENLAFFGRISASLSHELKNVLATLNEYSGLLDDLSRAAERGRDLDPGRLRAICEKMARQVRRGESLIERLNRFSHSADEPRRVVQVQEVLNEICDLCSRFAALRQVTLARILPEEPIRLTLDPFALQFAVQLLIDVALRSASEGQTVTVSLEPWGDAGARVIVAGAAAVDDAAREEHEPVLRELSRHLGAALAREGGSQWLTFEAAR